MISLQALLFYGVVFESLFWTPTNAVCTIDPIQKDPAPFIVSSGSTDFIYPDSNKKVLTFSKSESVDFICPGGKILVSSQSHGSVLPATCVEGDSFEIVDKKIEWNEITCDKEPVHTAQYNGLDCAGGKGKEIKVGYETGDGRYLTLYIICFNSETQEAFYSYHTVSLDIEEEKTKTPRPYWEQVDEFYNIGKATSYYYRDTQRETVNTLLGLSKGSTKYIQNGELFYLARGHMTARADNFYPAQQNASFMMMNVAPQWQSFNGENWEMIESSVRQYAQDNDVDLQVYTGVYGIATLPHASSGKETELWLYVDNNGRKALPVPDIYWKLVFNAKNEKGVVLIGINNPYIEEYKKICTDVSKSISWVDWKKSSKEYGFIYACEVDEFVKVVEFLPALSVKGLLE